jgi:serine/threonine protein kinase
MPIHVVRDSELIPGYRLLERQGEGGFGEVWKAEAPGGLLKAVKIISGCLQDNGQDADRLRQELKALNRVRTVRYPFILSLERFEIVDGRLVIVMELADRSLWDRFKECRAQGLPGIPRDELLRYTEEAAEAPDVMNVQYDLQHLDIKPQNLFLLYNHVKVGDFGLVKDLEGMSARATCGLTAVYAAPETFGGLVSRFCDQYNQAVAYQELLTGRLPFDGTNSRPHPRGGGVAAPEGPGADRQRPAGAPAPVHGPAHSLRGAEGSDRARGGGGRRDLARQDPRRRAVPGAARQRPSRGRGPAAFGEAQPELAGPRGGAGLCILAVPPGPEGEHFRALVERALPGETLLAAPSTDDIVFYREQSQVSLDALPQLGPAADEVYQQFLTPDQLSPHSRLDIVTWLAGPAPPG